MLTRLFQATLVVALVFSLAAFGQEAKKEAGKPLKSFACPDPCNFMVRSRDEKELTDVVLNHAKKIHSMAMTEADVKAKAKTVSEKKEKK